MNETQTFLKLNNKPKNNYPDYIICHHSGGTDANPLEDTSHHTAQMMEAWHLAKVPPWEGLGYHYVIHKDGTIWKGRPEHYQGAHTVGKNMSSVGICLSGNFDATLPSKEQENALKGLINDIRGRYNISTDKIVPHRAFASKTCYGNKLSNTWAKDLLTPTTQKEVILKKLAELKKLIEEIC